MKINQKNVDQTNAAQTNDTIDPFGHLHDESYHLAFSYPKITAETLIFPHPHCSFSLNGTWLCTLDPFEEGLRQNWMKEDHSISPKYWTIPRDYEVEAGLAVQVPGCLNNYQEKWEYYEGSAWFTKDFEWTIKGEERIFIRFGAVAYQARIFINGQFLGHHLGASTPFNVEVTEYLHDGKNRLQVQTDHSRHQHHIPMNHIDWFNYGGIYREVELIQLPKVFIQNFGIALDQSQLATEKSMRILVDVQLSNPANGQIFLKIPELNIDQCIDIILGSVKVEIYAQLQLWSPEQPKLYDISLSLSLSNKIIDEVVDRVGFRLIQVKGQQILLNNKPVWLKGVCVHEEYPQHGKAARIEDMQKMLLDAKALGSNFIRLSHYPHHEMVAKLADEIGFLLWEEIPVYWAIAFDQTATLNDALDQLQSLIRRDHNRASVIIWGVGNENADTDARYAFMSKLAKTAKLQDPSRLISAACLINRQTFCIEDRLIKHLDVIGINEYFGWYETDINLLTKLLDRSITDKPVLISETGADALAGHHGGVSELFTEECQADIYRQQIERVRHHSYINGLCAWVLYDFKSERRQTSFQKGFNRKGLISDDHLTKKLAFKVLGDLYRAM